MNEHIKTNQASITGTVTKGLEHSHSSHGETFYRTELTVPRNGSQKDNIPVMLSERLLDPAFLSDTNTIRGKRISLQGQLRSHSYQVNGQNRLALYAFARDIQILDDGTDQKDENIISLDAFLCRPVRTSVTPGGRNMTDAMMAVNRPYGKSDYIPVLGFGEEALSLTDMEIGDQCQLTGRIQSRTYRAKDGQNRDVYEVLINNIQKTKESNQTDDRKEDNL